MYDRNRFPNSSMYFSIQGYLTVTVEEFLRPFLLGDWSKAIDLQ